MRNHYFRERVGTALLYRAKHYLFSVSWAMHLISTSSVKWSLCSVDERTDKWVTLYPNQTVFTKPDGQPDLTRGLKSIVSRSLWCRYKGGPILFFNNYSVKFAMGVWEWEWSKPHIFYPEKATYPVSNKVTTKLLQMWIFQSKTCFNCKVHTKFWRFSVK